MNIISKASTSLYNYSCILDKEYSQLLKILNLEKNDISKDNMANLAIHNRQETETILYIKSLTNTINTYMGKIDTNKETLSLLLDVNKKREKAKTLSGENVELIKTKISTLKVRIESSNLPKISRRVYYSGDTSVNMDISI